MKKENLVRVQGRLHARGGEDELRIKGDEQRNRIE
jgi:hypothetical protein